MIAISSCVVGEACRFDGTNQELEKALQLEKYGNIIRVCPEVLAGLPTPRPPAEIQVINNETIVRSKNNIDVTLEFKKGASKTLEICKSNNIRYVILKDRSPSCGKGQIYNGLFEGRLVDGNGITSQLLIDNGIQVYTTSQAPYEKLMVYDFLDENNILFEKFTHQPVFTVEDAKEIRLDMKAQDCKNLFLETKNKKEKVLVVLPFDQRFNFKEVEKSIGIRKLKFASKESLKETLGVDPGSVGAFGLLYDSKKQVKVIISSRFDEDERITFHPNINDETLSIRYKDFLKFLKILEYDPIVVDL